jgi:hypothetical protein
MSVDAGAKASSDLPPLSADKTDDDVTAGPRNPRGGAIAPTWRVKAGISIGARIGGSLGNKHIIFNDEEVGSEVTHHLQVNLQ